MRKITKKGLLRLSLTAFRMMRYFILDSYNIAGQKNGANIWDYVRTIDITHKASTEQKLRYAELYHFRYKANYSEKGPIKTRPDYRNTTRAIVSMNKEAGQVQESRRTPNYRDDLDPEKLKWLIWLSHNWKWYFAMNRVSDSTSTRSEQEHDSGNRGRYTDSDQWKEN